MEPECGMQLKQSGYRVIGSSGHRKSCLFAAIAAFCLTAIVAYSSTRPHYGSTARLLIQHKITSLDPLIESDAPDERDKLSKLIFETLTQIDAQGRLHPGLAASWRAEAGYRVWQFQLRLAVFHDGAAVTSTVVIGSLKSAAADWKIGIVNRQTFTIETPVPAPHLPELLSLQRFAIVKRPSDSTLVGSGPYKLAQWQPGEHASLVANDDHWNGRPYPDAIEVQMGASLRDHLLERGLGRDHAVQLSIDQARALEQTSQNVIFSRPSELLVIVFLQSDQVGPVAHKKPVNPHVREALSYSLNRPAISNVLLQRKAAPATALLPQWLTGYEFMFPDKADLEQARKLRAEAGTVPAINLAYDFADPVSKMVAERIAVDAHEAGIVVQPYADAHVNAKTSRKLTNADAVLLRVPLPALEPSAALTGFAEELDLSQETFSAILSADKADDLFAAERKTLEDHRIIPVAHVSQVLWLNNTVHNWQQLGDGEWDLDQMWVESSR